MAMKIYVLGMGPGGENYITPAVSGLIGECDVLIGGKRHLALFDKPGRKEIAIGNNLEEIGRYLISVWERERGGGPEKTDAAVSEKEPEKKIAVLVTGDPGLFSMLGFLKRTLPEAELEVHPGVSSLQVLCARLDMNWDDMVIKSVHGREQEDLAETIRKNEKVALFTGGEHSPAAICGLLLENRLGHVWVSVGENLSYENERVVCGMPDEIAGMSFNTLSLMIIENPMVERPDAGSERSRGAWAFSTPGIPDDRFVRGEVPMTKEEVRAVAVSKLRLSGSETVYDIGAGTGSVSVECALRCRHGRVYAIEKEEDALELIRKNAELFGLNNIEVIAGRAPCLEAGLPAPDRVFIGGSGGGMDEIVRWAGGQGKPVRVVINTIAVESTAEALESLDREGFAGIEIISLSVSRGRRVGGKHMMQALNPVYIISAEKG